MRVSLIAAFAALLMATATAGPPKLSTKPPVYKAPKFKQRGGAKPFHRPANKSERAKQDFRAVNPCPSTGKTTGRCPGFELQHKTPLSQGGVEADTNLQWLSKK